MGQRRYTIKQLPPELRPRERLLSEGPEALSSADARYSARDGQQGEYGGCACWGDHLREWRPLWFARGLHASPKTQRQSACVLAPCCPRTVPSGWNWQERREP